MYNRHMKRINMYLSLPQLALLRQHMKDTGLTLSEIIRRAIDDYLKHQG